MVDIYKNIVEYNPNSKEESQNIDCLWWYNCRYA